MLGIPIERKINTREVDGAKWVTYKFEDIEFENLDNSDIERSFRDIKLLVTEGGIKLKNRRELINIFEAYKRDLFTQINNGVRKLFNVKGSNALIYELGETGMLVKENRPHTTTSYLDAFNRMDILEHLCNKDKRIPPWVGVPEHYGLIEFYEHVYNSETGTEDISFRTFILMRKVNSGTSLQDLLSYCDNQVDNLTKMTIEAKYGESIKKEEEKKRIKEHLLPQLAVMRRQLDLVIDDFASKNPDQPRKLLVDLFENGKVNKNLGNIVVEQIPETERANYATKDDELPQFKFWIIDQ